METKDKITPNYFLPEFARTKEKWIAHSFRASDNTCCAGCNTSGGNYSTLKNH